MKKILNLFIVSTLSMVSISSLKPLVTNTINHNSLKSAQHNNNVKTLGDFNGKKYFNGTSSSYNDVVSSISWSPIQITEKSVLHLNHLRVRAATTSFNSNNLKADPKWKDTGWVDYSTYTISGNELLNGIVNHFDSGEAYWKGDWLGAHGEIQISINIWYDKNSKEIFYNAYVVEKSYLGQNSLEVAWDSSGAYIS